MTSRVIRYIAIGGLGFAVQMLVAGVCLALGMAPVLATLVAIEAALVHNHAWHRRWGWGGCADAAPWPLTLLRAHVGVGVTSLPLGVGTVGLLAGLVPPLPAQALAVALCAVANYWLTDRWVLSRARGPMLLALLVLVLPQSAYASAPSRAALQSWERYVAALEQARTADDARGVAPWATDEDRSGERTRAALLRGDVVITRRRVPSAQVDDATLEHWQGSVLLLGVSLPDVAHRLRHPDAYPQPPDVRSLRVTERSQAGHELYLRLTRSMLVTATYDTWHRVRHQTRDAGRLDSVSVATRIAEVGQAGTAAERRLPAEDSRGFLWRMQSYWRFTAVEDGVFATCESITLSRPVPFGLGLVTRPVISRVARESMSTAITAWQRGWREPGAAR